MYMVGGEEEKVYLKKHKGFVREAIKVRVAVLPHRRCAAVRYD